MAIFEIDFKAEPIPTDPLSRKFVAVNAENRKVEWNFGDGTPVSAEPSPVHTYQFAGGEQKFVVTLSVTDGPCKVSREQSITISRPIPTKFSIQPTVFCSNDRTKRIFSIEPSPTDISEIKNPDKLVIEKDSSGIFFIPAKQEIGQTKQYTLTYRNITSSLKIIVPNAGFTMNLTHNPSPVAVFPTFLTLKAKEANAIKYQWRLTNVAGFALNFSTKDVENLNIAELQLPQGAAIVINIFLTVTVVDQTGVSCEATKDYIITSDIFGKHLNKGEFDNLTSF